MRRVTESISKAVFVWRVSAQIRLLEIVADEESLEGAPAVRAKMRGRIKIKLARGEGEMRGEHDATSYPSKDSSSATRADLQRTYLR
jgi:hypothetical protein